MTTAEMLRAEERAATLAELLTDRFGPLPDDVQECLTSASLEQIKTWTRQVLRATTLAEALR